MKLHSNRLPQSFDNDGDRTPVVEEEENCQRGNSFNLLSLPSDILISQLSYLGIKEVEQSVKFTCKAFYALCHAQPLWREFCLQTGKLNMDYDPSNSSYSYSKGDHNKLNYKDLYESTPCVPVDFPTITGALQYYLTAKDRLSKSLSPTFTITLMPAVYHERIEIVANNLTSTASSTSEQRSGRLQLRQQQPEHDICIRAAFHDKGAAIVHYSQNKMNQPCVSIVNEHNRENSNGMDEHNQKRTLLNVTLQNLQFLHFTKGSDIWNGNCALQVDGHNLNVNILSCSFQSDSGRGLVVTRGAHLNMKNTTVHDSAATGIYIGDLNSDSCIEGCNIIRNGGGTRLPTSVTGIRENQIAVREVMATADADVASEHDHADNNIDDIHIDFPIYHYDQDVDDLQLVPPGHSGMYLESSTSIVKDCALTNNSLTGLSVVRGGKIKICNCDIFSNGSDPVTIEDAHDVLLGLGEGIRGGVEDLGGNCYSRPSSEGGNPQDNHLIAFARRTIFPHTIYGHMTVARLRELYSS